MLELRMPTPTLARGHGNLVNKAREELRQIDILPLLSAEPSEFSRTSTNSWTVSSAHGSVSRQLWVHVEGAVATGLDSSL